MLQRPSGFIIFIQVVFGSFLILPLVSFGQCKTAYPSQETFETSNGGWTTGGNAPDWAWGTPNKSVIKTAGGGTKCWIVGGLTKTAYNNGELAWVKSPCYNFSTLKYPTVGFKVYWETEYGFDGTVLEYSIDNGSTWNAVGSTADGKNCLNLNWFNSNKIKYISNGNGWSGSSVNGTDGASCGQGNGSNGWVVSSHTMPYLAGRTNVQFRFLFGAGTNCNGYNGFAFDDFTIGEAPANAGLLNYTCVNASTVSFSYTTLLCPALSWNFGDPGSGAANTSTAATPTHTFSGPGVYTVTLKATGPDNAPATYTKTITILDLTTQILKAPLCSGDKTGTISVTTLPAVPGLGYSWNTSPLQNTATATNTGAGTYLVTVTGTDVCTAADNVTVTEPAVLASAVTIQQPSCKNNDGIIRLANSGGTPPYSFAWTPAVSTADSAKNLAQGNYSVVITDKNGCTITRSATLTAPPSVTAAVTTSPVSCFGKADGKATVATSSGTAPFTYSWSPLGGTGVLASGLAAGNYTVTVTDATGCNATLGTTISEPAQLDFTLITKDALCSNNGTIVATVTGGTAPYNYQWTPAAGNVPSVSLLPAGTYQLTVTDNNGCTHIDSAKINAVNSSLSISGSVTDVNCFGGKTGSVSVTASGGTAPFTYLWNNGANTAMISSVGAGNYDLTVTDQTGCTTSASYMVTEPTQLLVSATAVNPVCGGAGGDVNLSISGGNSPYLFNWSNGSALQNQSGLATGTYTVKVTDKNGCSANAGATVNVPATLNISMATNATTCGKNDGAISAAVSGGTAPYSYSWASGQNTAAIATLAAGNYTLTVTDKNGCTQTATAAIAASSAPVAVISHTDVTCFGQANGTALLSVNGGLKPYTYAWSNGDNSAAVTSLPAGKYTVTITDKQNCITTAATDVGEPAALQASLLATTISCAGGKADITSTLTGGMPAYIYSWSNGSTSTSLTGISGGNYTLTVTDKNGCKATATATVTVPAALTVQLTPQPTSCGATNGAVNSLVSGGTVPYTYAWASGQITANISALAAGVYTMNVTDKNGCTQTANATVTASSAVSVQPAYTDVSCFGKADGTGTITVSGGATPYTYAWSNGASSANISGLAGGKYTVIVADKQNCLATASINIAEPTDLKVALTATDALCAAGTGSVTSTVSGGAGGYHYNWSNGTTTADITSIPSGSYTLTVADKNGCKTVVGTAVKAPAAIDIQFAVLNTLCGASNGSISSSVAGGTAPYAYAWVPGNQTSTSISNLGAGNYTLKITDKNGCTVSKSATVSTPGQLSTSINTTSILCQGDNNGTATITASGGTVPYSIAWNTGDKTAAISNLKAGTYSVSVTDATGCVVTNHATITEPAALAVTPTATSAICLAPTGTLAAVVSGGVLPYTYNWQPGGQSVPLVSNLTAGTYSLTVTDRNGCKKQASAVITTSNPLKISLGKDTTICGSNGFTLNAGSFSAYLWQNGSRNATMPVTGAGTYWVQVTDSRGCVASDTLNVVADCGEIWFPTAFTPNSDGRNDGFGPLGNTALISGFSMTVFNRWGEKVFESYNPRTKWNGTYRGYTTIGTYVWFARFIGRDGKQQVKKGSVMLVR